MPVHCLVCEKILIQDDNFIYDAGIAQLSFAYGSRHDRGAFCGDPLLRANCIEFYLCDDCFDKKKTFIRGFNVKTTVEKTEI